MTAAGALSVPGGPKRAGYLAARWHRLNGPARLAGVDLARGFAVIGMFAAHLLSTPERWVWTDASTWSSIVDGRSSILFATLAGVSIGLVTGGPAPLPAKRLAIARGRIAVRAGLLLILGILLILTGVPVYVILPAYAILFLLALPFTALPARPLLWTALGAGLILSFVQPLLDELPVWTTPIGSDVSLAIGWNYPFTLWIAFVLAGLGIARAGLTSLAVQVRMLVAGAVLAAVGYSLAELPPPGDDLYWWMVWSADPHSSGLWEVLGSGGFAIAVIGGCLLLCRVTAVTLVMLPVRATGAMPLTAYTAQLLVWAAIALATLGDTGDLRGFRALDPFWPLTLWIIAACTAWALLVGRGPLEWVIDRIARLVRRNGSAPAIGRLDG
jgi:hypothetical protein